VAPLPSDDDAARATPATAPLLVALAIVTAHAWALAGGIAWGGGPLRDVRVAQSAFAAALAQVHTATRLTVTGLASGIVGVDLLLLLAAGLEGSLAATLSAQGLVSQGRAAFLRASRTAAALATSSSNNSSGGGHAAAATALSDALTAALVRLTELGGGGGADDDVLGLANRHGVEDVDTALEAELEGTLTGATYVLPRPAGPPGGAKRR